MMSTAIVIHVNRPLCTQRMWWLMRARRGRRFFNSICTAVRVCAAVLSLSYVLDFLDIWWRGSAALQKFWCCWLSHTYSDPRNYGRIRFCVKFHIIFCISTCSNFLAQLFHESTSILRRNEKKVFAGTFTRVTKHGHVHTQIMPSAISDRRCRSQSAGEGQYASKPSIIIVNLTNLIAGYQGWTV